MPKRQSAARKPAVISPAPDNAAPPRWNLKDLYASPDSPLLAADAGRAATGATAFAAHYAGKIALLSPKQLAQALHEYEALASTIARVESYLELKQAENLLDNQAQICAGKLSKPLSQARQELIFFELELLQSPDAHFQQLLLDPALVPWAGWLQRIRAHAPHSLNIDVEKILAARAPVWQQPWQELHAQLLAATMVVIDGQPYSLSAALQRLHASDASQRQAAAKAITAALEPQAEVFAHIYSTLIKMHSIDAEQRSHQQVDAPMHQANQIDPTIVQTMQASSKRHLPALSHRYYQLKANMLGQAELSYADRAAALPSQSPAPIPFAAAAKQVVEAYRHFSPSMAKLAEDFFTQHWIDADIRNGKMGGAFAAPTVPEVHPYILLNYHGSRRDVATLAHEIGHGIHQRLAADQGFLCSQTPLILAETASVFGEMLCFQAQLAAEQDPLQRRAMLAGKIEDMLNTSFRQMAFYEFELRCHAARQDGDLTAAAINSIWRAVMQENLGPAFANAADLDYHWMYIPHFINSPFYVYAYAFGDAVVNNLWQEYQRQPAGFADKFYDLLAAGGSAPPMELLAQIGLDASRPDFFDQGYGVLENLLQQLEQLNQQINAAAKIAAKAANDNPPPPAP